MPSKSKTPQGGAAQLAQNVMAGLTVSFIALTLGAAFGILSGRGAFAGMLSAAVIALITSLFGGTRVQCSGPTAPMTAVTAVLVAATHDKIMQQFAGLNPDHFINMAILMGGVIMLAMGILRLGKYIAYVPNVVVSGFMSGIAILIWLDQLKRLFGWAGKTALAGDLMTNVIVAAVTAVLVFGLPRYIKKYLGRLGSMLSSTLLAILIMSLVSNLLHLDIEYVKLTGSLASLVDFKNLVVAQWPTDWSSGLLVAALPFALQLAVLGYLDTLMTSLVVDKMTREKTKQNKELGAQGIANIAAGLFGGIPGAQATIRSVLIVKENATLRLAGILVGVFALIEILLFQNLINLIPQAVFTGVLFKVGYDVFDWLPLRLYAKEWFRDRHEMLHNVFSRHNDESIFVTNREFLMIAGTTLVTIFINLNVAAGAFTVLFYLHNKLLVRRNPMRDLIPVTETEAGLAED